MAVRNFLENRLGKEVEVCCEGITVSGKATKVEGNVLHLEKDGVTAYVNIEKIIIVWDSQEKKAHSRALFRNLNSVFGAGLGRARRSRLTPGGRRLIGAALFGPARRCACSRLSGFSNLSDLSK